MRVVEPKVNLVVTADDIATIMRFMDCIDDLCNYVPWQITPIQLIDEFCEITGMDTASQYDLEHFIVKVVDKGEE